MVPADTPQNGRVNSIHKEFAFILNFAMIMWKAGWMGDKLHLPVWLLASSYIQTQRKPKKYRFQVLSNKVGTSFQELFWNGFGQQEKALQSNASSHWLSPYPDLFLHFCEGFKCTSWLGGNEKYVVRKRLYLMDGWIANYDQRRSIKSNIFLFFLTSLQ